MSSELPENWVECEICDVAKVVGGGTPPSKDPTNFTTQGGIPWITPADLSGYKDAYISKGARNLSEKGYSACSAMKMPAGSVLFSSRAPVGYVAIASTEVTTSQGFKSFVLTESTDSRFVYYYLRHIKPIAEMMATGTTFKELSGSVAAKLPFVLAPLNEQKRIADKLDALLARVDACRDRLDRVPQILKRFRQSVLAAATSGALTEEWREDQGEEFELEKVRIGDLLAEKPRNGYSPKAVAFQTNTRSLTLSATTSGRFNRAHSKYIDEDIPKNSHLWLMPGDILIQRANSIEYVGVSAIYDGPVESFIYPDLMMKCRPNHRVLTECLYYILSSEPVRNYFRENATGTAGNMPKINQQTVVSAPALVPKLSEQREIVRRVEILFSFANRLEARYAAGLEQVAQLTPSLLNKAFRGELVPQAPNDEPASELLKRIKEGKANEPEQKREPRTNKIKKERHVKTKTVTTLNELVSALDQLGGNATADRLVIESGLSGDIDRFFELLREGRNTLLDVPVGSNEPIRRITDANQ